MRGPRGSTLKIESSGANGDGGSVSEAHGANLGNSGERATYWLIVDRRTNQGFVTAAAEAYSPDYSPVPGGCAGDAGQQQPEGLARMVRAEVEADGRDGAIGGLPDPAADLDDP